MTFPAAFVAYGMSHGAVVTWALAEVENSLHNGYAVAPRSAVTT